MSAPESQKAQDVQERQELTNTQQAQKRPSNGTWRSAFAAAFPHTLPICAGFLFLGTTYGVFMNVSGFPLHDSLLTSLCIFAGSMQFVMVNLLLGAFDLLQAVLMTLMVNARHVFYGISLLEKYRHTGWKKLYLIFGLCDETFSINCTVEPPAGVDRGRFMTAVTLLNQSYWVLGTLLGGIFGNFVFFSTEGLDFCMTALFVVIFLEQLRTKSNHVPALLGIGLTLLSLILFGADSFLLPAMGAILLTLLLLRKPLEKGVDRP